MLLIPLQPQQPMNPCSHQAIFRPKCSYTLCNTIGNAGAFGWNWCRVASIHFSARNCLFTQLLFVLRWLLTVVFFKKKLQFAKTVFILTSIDLKAEQDS